MKLKVVSPFLMGSQNPLEKGNKLVKVGDVIEVNDEYYTSIQATEKRLNVTLVEKVKSRGKSKEE